jgi:putative DNA primase/helicase
MFEHLHGAADGNAFATLLNEAARTFYGHAGPEFVRLLIGDRAAWSGLREEVAALATRLAGTNADGQVQRVARRFALVAVAGELATRYGITGWQPGEAIRAARECLGSWIAQRGGTGNREPAEVLAQVRGFLELHGDSRFAPRRDDEGSEASRYPVRDRAGFREPTPEGPKFYVLGEVMRKEVLAGLNERDAVKVLIDRGVLQPDNNGKATRSERLPGMRTRVYVITPKLWESTDDA